MQSVPYKDVVKVYGLPRSGTTYLEMLVRENFDTLVLNDHLGFQHGEIIKEIDWTGQNWPNPDYWSEKRIELLNRVVLTYKNDIQRRFDRDELYFLIIVKNPYAWYHSIRLSSRAQMEPFIPQIIEHWNNRNSHYLQYCHDHYKNTMVVRFEDFYYGGFKIVLDRMKDKFKLEKRLDEYNNIPQVVSQRTVESDKGEFNMKKYEEKFYLDKLGDKVVKGISSKVNLRLMEYFGYMLES